MIALYIIQKHIIKLSSFLFILSIYECVLRVLTFLIIDMTTFLKYTHFKFDCVLECTNNFHYMDYENGKSQNLTLQLFLFDCISQMPF